MKTPPPIKKKDKTLENYFVQINHEQMGPYDSEKIKVLLEFKNIDENTLIWKEGMNDWDIISNLEEFNKHLILPKLEKKTTEEKISLDPNEQSEINVQSVKNNYTKWFNVTSLITLFVSSLSLTGAIHQYFQFQNNKEIDMSYIMSISGWGSLISILLSLICVIYLLIKKTKSLKGFISLIVGISALFLLKHTTSTYRSYWRPYWDIQEDLYGSYTGTQQDADAIREGWRTGRIDLDSLNSLKYHSISNNNSNLEVIDNNEKSNEEQLKSELNEEIKKLDLKIENLTRKKNKNTQFILDNKEHDHEAAVLSGSCYRSLCMWAVDRYELEEENENIEIQLKKLLDLRNKLINQ
jgi:hypothetical protein